MELHRYHDVNRRGTIQRLCYSTKDEDGTAVSKYANVYLPYQYASEQAYPVLYLIHGGGGNPDSSRDGETARRRAGGAVRAGSLPVCDHVRRRGADGFRR